MKHIFFCAVFLFAFCLSAFAASSITPVDLSKYFNNCGVSSAGETPDLDFANSGYCGDSFPVKTLTANGIPFSVPALKKGAPDNISSQAQVIDVPKGKYAVIYALCASSSVDYLEDLILTYSDGSSSKELFGVSDWMGEPKFGETNAAAFPAMIRKGERTEFPCCLYAQGVIADPLKELVTLTLPQNASIHIFALSLDKNPPPSWVTSRTYDLKKWGRYAYTQEQTGTDSLLLSNRTPMEVTFGFDFSKSDKSARRAAKLCRDLGMTAAEMYIHVLWDVVEPQPGVFNWKNDDRNVKILKEFGEGWMPFIIVGSWYSFPDWFRKSEKHYPYVCLEHNQATADQSLWSPYLKAEIDRFIGIFAQRYADKKVIKRVLLGVTGDYGESIYPAGGNWNTKYHVHTGFWCGDENAKKDFKEFLKAKYLTAEKLNAAWKASFADFAAISPVLRKSALSSRHWLDQMEWYRKSMTDFTEFWVSTTRKYFADVPPVICTGGSDANCLGSDFSAQIKMAKKYNGGIRITNEGSDYAANFTMTRQVASAARFYDIPFSYEPAGNVTPKGVVARMFGAAAAGADEVHFYGGNVFASDSGKTIPQATDAFFRHKAFLTKAAPLIDIAVLCPRIDFAVAEERYGEFYARSAGMRDWFDHDYLDEWMIMDGALDKYRFLVMLEGNITEQKVWDKISEWIKAGGIFVTYDMGASFQTPEGDKKAQADIIGSDEYPAEIKSMAAADLPSYFVLNVGITGDEPYLTGDWNGIEGGNESSHWRWSGTKCGFRFTVNPQKDYVFRLTADCPVPGKLFVNGKEAADISAGMEPVEISGKELKGKTGLEIMMEVEGWMPAEKMPGSSDNRTLGIMVRSAELYESGASEEEKVFHNRIKVKQIDTGKVLDRCLVKKDKGYVALFPGTWADNAGYFQTIRALRAKFGVYPEVDGEKDGLFAVLQQDRIIYYNSTEEKIEKTIRIPADKVTGSGIAKPAANEYKITLEPNSIGCVLFSEKDPINGVSVFEAAKKPSAAEISFKLGMKNSEKGLVQGDGEDGLTEPAEKEGKSCRKLVPNKYGGGRFLYCKAGPDFKPGKKVEIEIEYFDEGTGSIALNYDSKEGPWKTPGDGIALEDSGSWKKYVFTIEDADFKKRCNGFDFRFAYDNDLFVSVIKVTNK